MKTLSIVSTQMQLLNCIEYITMNKLQGNHLILFALSPARISQLKDMLSVSCNKGIFDKVSIFAFGNIRLINFLKAIALFFYVLFLTRKRGYKVCILGHYTVSFGRKFWAERPDVERIVVDDGAATVTWFNIRIKEIASGCPQISYTNRFLHFLIRRNKSLMPASVTFFSIYKSLLPSSDVIIQNEYKYLQENIKSYPHALSVLSSSFIFLGQPLYIDDMVSIENYNNYLLKIHRLIGQDFIYYPHPIEKDISWMSREVKKHFKIVPNRFSFEIYALASKAPLTIVSFYTSALPVLKMLRPNFKLYSIKFDEIKSLPQRNAINLENVYNYYKSIEIEVLSI